jgi:DNA-binding LytR/AlgR family response regulator
MRSVTASTQARANGIDAARSIARRAEIVFVTAQEHYAVQAFEQGAIDYVVKPFEETRLANSVERLRSRLVAPQPLAAGLDAVLDRLATELKLRGDAEAPRYLRWIRASVGSSVRLIPVEQIAFLRSDEKYPRLGRRRGSEPQDDPRARRRARSRRLRADPSIGDR